MLFDKLNKKIVALVNYFWQLFRFFFVHNTFLVVYFLLMQSVVIFVCLPVLGMDFDCFFFERLTLYLLFGLGTAQILSIIQDYIFNPFAAKLLSNIFVLTSVGFFLFI